MSYNSTAELFESSINFLSTNEYIAPILAHVNAYQLLVDIVLLAIALYVVFRKPAVATEKPLTQQEIDEIIEGWEPEPLIPKKTDLMKLDDDVPLIESSTGTHCVIKGKKVLNMARVNYLGMINNPRVEEEAIKTLRKYGTGTCGPRGFNGTIDVHLDLEKRIQKFMDSEDACIYSYGFATVSSAIPAFSARGDLLIVDKGVNYSVQTGVKLSRSDVMWFKHNDMEDLENILKKVAKEDKATGRKVTRRFIVIEGLYFNFGDVAPLDKIMQLKEKYCYRLIMDDSTGLGVLGKTGRGTCEHFGVPVKKVEILTGTLEGATSSVGGFCCGEKQIIYHQRLNSSGYVYSCSLPPLLTTASLTALDILEENPSLVDSLRKNSEYFVKEVSKIPGITVTSLSTSPVVHIRLTDTPTDRLKAETLLQNISKEALNRGVFITRAKYVHSFEAFLPPPSLRVFISAVHTNQQLQEAVGAIRASVEQVLKKK